MRTLTLLVLLLSSSLCSFAQTPNSISNKDRVTIIRWMLAEYEPLKKALAEAPAVYLLKDELPSGFRVPQGIVIVTREDVEAHVDETPSFTYFKFRRFAIKSPDEVEVDFGSCTGGGANYGASGGTWVFRKDGGKWRAKATIGWGEAV